jgi:hypothetical protein
MRWFALAMLVGCAEPTGLGVAESNGFDTAASATVIVANGSDGAGGSLRIWSIEIGEAAPGTDCHNRGDALIVFDVYTKLNSAPRGEIPMEQGEPPPMIFPRVYPRFANGNAIDGMLVIDAASSTRMLGSFRGQTEIEGAVLTLEATFDAPTCGV